jgi:hypothetical protein
MLVPVTPGSGVALAHSVLNYEIVARQLAIAPTTALRDEGY